MSIAKFKPLVRPPVPPVLPKIESPTYKSIVVDDSQRALNTLVTYMEGTPWTVDYYSQVISADNDIREHDPGQVSIYQQYTKIIELEIRVTSPLTSSQDTESTLVTVNGAALIYPFLTPNVGDMFVAEAGNGRQGIYRILNVERKTFDREAAFSVDYELIAYTDVDVQRFNDLNIKVIRTYYFSKDRLVEGLAPNLLENDHKKMGDLQRMFKVLCEYYYKTFFNRSVSTLIVPGQETIIYDHFVPKFLSSIVDTFDAPEIRLTNLMSTELNEFLNQEQFWNILLNREYGRLKYCNREMGLVHITHFSKIPVLAGLRYSAIQYVVYPVIADSSVFSGNGQPILENVALTTILPARSDDTGSLVDLINNQYVGQNSTVPLLKPVLVDKFYVFSDEFYEGKAGQSLIEVLTTEYIKGNSVDHNKLWDLIQRYQTWGRLEQYYYIPIILTLIKSTVKGLY